MTASNHLLLCILIVLLTLSQAIHVHATLSGGGQYYDPFSIHILKFDVFRNKFVLKCVGNAISENWIITSVDCTEGVSDFRQLIFTSRKECSSSNSNNCPKEVWHYLIERKIHQMYNSSTGEYNVALLKIEPSLSFEGRIQKVTLPPKDFKCNGDMISAWRTNMHHRNSSMVNLSKFGKIKLNIVNPEYCNTGMYNDTHVICNKGIVNTVLANEDQVHEGEIGSGVFCNDRNHTFLCGIFSKRVKDLNGRHIFMFTNVQSIESWVKQATRIPKQLKYDNFIYLSIIVLLAAIFMAITVLIKVYICPAAITKDNYKIIKLSNSKP